MFFHNSVKVYRDGLNSLAYRRSPEDDLIAEFANNFSYEQLAKNEIFVERLKERVNELKLHDDEVYKYRETLP